jgi:hypothetical protein
VGLQKAGFRLYSSVAGIMEGSPALGAREASTHSMSPEDNNQQVTTGDQQLEFPQDLSDPVRRRAWLLVKALETQPLDQALELARAAETFLTDTGDNNVAALYGPAAALSAGDVATSLGEQPAKRASVVLAPEARDRLLNRIAKGARNAELASEFGLTPKQVQGIRMGSAREINRRRTRFSASGA